MPKFLTSIFVESPPGGGEYYPSLLEVGQLIRDGSVFSFLAKYFREYISEHHNPDNDVYYLPIEEGSKNVKIRVFNYRRLSNFMASLKLRYDPLEVALTEMAGREEFIAPKPPIAMFLTSSETFDEQFFNYNRVLGSFYLAFYKFKGFINEAVDFNLGLIEGSDLSNKTFGYYFDLYQRNIFDVLKKAQEIESEYGSRLADLFYLAARSPVFASSSFLTFPSIKDCREGEVILKLVPMSFRVRIDFVMPSKLSTIYPSSETLKNRIASLFINPVVQIPTIRYPLVWDKNSNVSLWFEADVPVFYTLESYDETTEWEGAVPPNVTVVSLSLNGYYMRPIFDRIVRSGEGTFLDPLFVDKLTGRKGKKGTGSYVERVIVRLNVSGVNINQNVGVS